MTAPAPIAPLNLPPERFHGRIHERIKSRDPDSEDAIAIVILGGKEGETISLQLDAPFLSASTELTPEAAIRIGEVLVAAGRESLGLEGSES